ncbi:hypothetical protein HHK36_022541 [Tetracentron sinense]|uniref:Uncharacterized protein n=1 Tax=Tetracentron sinense TaxID=13715 RepID=A0A834YN14_TETSI|nr:hypothetical protein HHK36_022541 [Tetracentron sinense]
MGRAPCCEKMGLKKGPWTSEEDQTLIAYIQQYGHGNWRALPKQAGALPEDNSGMPSDFPALVSDPQFLYPPSPVSLVEPVYAFSSNMDDCMGFWYNLFMRAGELQELPEM